MVGDMVTDPRPRIARERSRHRTLWLRMSGLTLLGIGAIVAHHLVPEALPYHEYAPITWTTIRAATDANAVLEMVLVTVHHGFHLLLVTGFLYAAWDRYRAWRGLTHVLRLVDTHAPQPRTRVWKAARAAGLTPARVQVVRWLPDPAFTVGWLRPTVYVAQPLVDRLSRDELMSVLAHERAHTVRRDPLRLAILRWIACGLFWIPVLRQLVQDIVDETEVQADDVALTYVGNRSMTLAAAIMQAAAFRTYARCGSPDRTPWATAGVTGVVGTAVDSGDGRVVGLLERRVRRLMGEDPPITTHVTRTAVIIATITLLLGWLSGIAIVR